MRLIDADALREEIIKNKKVAGRFIEGVIMLIDNAPTVEPEKALIANVSFDEDKLKEIIQTEVIDKIKNGELILKADERPQGEWIEDSGVIACSHCHTIWLYRKTDYCANCGAEMKGGAE